MIIKHLNKNVAGTVNHHTHFDKDCQEVFLGLLFATIGHGQDFNGLLLELQSYFDHCYCILYEIYENAFKGNFHELVEQIIKSV